MQFALERQGDRHLGGAAVAIRGECSQFFLKWGVTVRTEAAVLSLLNDISSNDLGIELGLHSQAFFFEPAAEVLCLEWMPGVNYKDLELYEFACNQLQLLFDNVQGSEFFRESLLRILDSPPQSSYDIGVAVCNALLSFPEWRELRAELARHYDIDLEGEGFRGISEIVSSVSHSQTGKLLKLHRSSSVRRHEALAEHFLGQKNTQRRALEHLHRQLGFYRYFAEAIDLYDAHKENFLVLPATAESLPKLVLTDFECAMGGTSRAMMPEALDVFLQTSTPEENENYRMLVRATEAELSNNRRIQQLVSRFRGSLLCQMPQLRKRVIYVGSSVYASAIKALKEGLFLAEAMTLTQEYVLEPDEDLIGASRMVLSYQMWKRFYRGMGRWPRGAPCSLENQLQSIRTFLLDYPKPAADPLHVESLYRRLERLKERPIAGEVERALLTKVLRPLARLPHRLFFPDLHDSSWECALAEIVTSGRRPTSLLEQHVWEMVDAITSFCIPHHTLPIHWPSVTTSEIIEDAKKLWESAEDNDVEVRIELTKQFAEAIWVH